MPTPIKLHVRLENGHLLSRKNAHCIRAYCDRLCTTVISPKIDPMTCRETYVVYWCRKGYHFQEITHGMGVCGEHKSLRALVARTIGLGIRVVVLDEEEAKLPPRYQPVSR